MKTTTKQRAAISENYTNRHPGCLHGNFEMDLIEDINEAVAARNVALENEGFYCTQYYEMRALLQEWHERYGKDGQFSDLWRRTDKIFTEQEKSPE